MIRRLAATTALACAGATASAAPTLPPRNALTDFTALHAFIGADGAKPDAALVRGPGDGLYGSTELGGSSGLGTLFRITPDGTLTTIHSFAGADGAHPTSALILSRDGFLYGTASGGGDAAGGTAFRIDADGRFERLHSFSGGADGWSPRGALLEASDGQLYGTTFGGGANFSGTAFRLARDGSVTTLTDFGSSSGGPSGQSPRVPLVETPDGLLWGGTDHVLNFDCGTLFAIDKDGQLAHGYTFVTDEAGCNLRSAFTLGRDGLLYGNGSGGWNNAGVTYTMNPAAPTSPHLLRSFTRTGDASRPESALVEGPRGTLYGTAYLGGAFGQPGCAPTGCGAVYAMTRKGHVKVLHAFHGSDGAQPTAGLVQGADGAYYGTTTAGGANGQGTVFRIAPAKRP